MGAQDKVKQTWALPLGSSQPAGEMMGTHLALGTSMGVVQALSHLPVGVLLPDETGLPHLQEGAHSRAETRMLQASGAPLSTPRVCEP